MSRIALFDSRRYLISADTASTRRMMGSTPSNTQPAIIQPPIIPAAHHAFISRLHSSKTLRCWVFIYRAGVMLVIVLFAPSERNSKFTF